jgi:hypothetical protein
VIDLSTKIADDEPLIRYLLGRTDERESLAIEEQYFEDEEHFARLEVAADDLAAAYVRGRLSPEDRERFEQYCLGSRDDRLRARIADALARSSITARVEKPVAGFAAVAAAIRSSWRSQYRIAAGAAAVLVLVSSVLGVRVVQLQRELARTSIESATERAAADRRVLEAARQVEAERERRQTLERQAQEVRTVQFALMPGIERGSGAALQIPQGTSFIRLALALEGKLPPGRLLASLRTTNRDVVWSAGVDTPAAEADSVAITVPAAALDSGEYEIVLKVVGGGRETEIANYAFTLVEQRR